MAAGRRLQVRGVSIAVTVESKRLDVSGCRQELEFSSDLDSEPGAMFNMCRAAAHQLGVSTFHSNFHRCRGCKCRHSIDWQHVIGDRPRWFLTLPFSNVHSLLRALQALGSFNIVMSYTAVCNGQGHVGHQMAKCTIFACIAESRDDLSNVHWVCVAHSSSIKADFKHAAGFTFKKIGR